MAALNTSRPDGVPEAGRRRYVDGEPIGVPSLGVFLVKEDASRVGGKAGPLTRRELRIAVQAIAAVEDPGEADDAIAPMREWVVSVLGGTTLDGLALDVTEVGAQWETASKGLFVIACTMLFAVEYQSLKADLTARQ